MLTLPVKSFTQPITNAKEARSKLERASYNVTILYDNYQLCEIFLHIR